MATKNKEIVIWIVFDSDGHWDYRESRPDDHKYAIVHEIHIPIPIAKVVVTHIKEK